LIKVSATLGDSRADPYFTTDPNASGWWASPLGEKKADFSIIFDRKYFVQEINIIWKFKPKKIQINIMTENK